MEQDQVPDLNDVAGWLADFYEELRTMRATLAAPEHYSVDPDHVRPWFQRLNENRASMHNQLAWFRHLMMEEFSLSQYIPEVLPDKEMSPDNAMARFIQSDAPLEQRLDQLEQAYGNSFEIVSSLVEDVMGKYDHDVKMVAEATGIANSGDFKRATDLMGGASRMFKNVAYWQPDRQASKMASMLDTVEKDFKVRQIKVEELTAGLESKATLQTGKAASEARTVISEGSGELMKARKAFPDADPNSPYATQLAELEGQIINWQGEQAARLDAADRSSQQYKKKLIQYSIIAGVAIVVVALALLWMNTGYRIVSPTGEERSASFALPGEYEVQFEVPGYQTYTAKVPVSFGFYNDMGQIGTGDLKPFTVAAKLDATPAGATYDLRPINSTLKPRSGKVPASFDDLAVGKYELTLRLGDHREKHVIEIKKDDTFDQTFSLQVGSLELTTDPAGAEVILGGESAGNTPFKRSGMAPGEHTVQLLVDGNTINLPVEIKPGETTKLEHKIGFGSVKITTDPPGANLSFPDAPAMPATKAPYENGKVFARTYKVQADYPGLEPKVFDVTVKPGETTEQVLHLDYGSLLIDAKPQLGTSVAVVDLPAERYAGDAPLKLTAIKPGTYKIMALSASKQKMFKEVEVKAGMRDEPVNFEFANGSLKLISEPKGLKVSIPELDVFNEHTPVNLESVVVGDYTATFHHANSIVKRKFTVNKGATATVEANFLDTTLKDRSDIQPYTKANFKNDNTIQPGVGLKHAQVAQRLEPAFQAYGKPDGLRKLPDPERGSKFIVTYNNMGLTMVTDGVIIESITFTPVPSKDPNRQPSRYWARTDKGVTLGDDVDKVRRNYGDPVQASSTKLDYDGLEFFTRSGEVIGIRITEPTNPPAPENAGTAKPTSGPAPTGGS